MTTMKAVRVHDFGGLDTIRFDTVVQPVPTSDQVLVRIHAAGVNPVDWELSYGINQEFMGRILPTTLGFDVSGEIAQVGSNVTGFNVGDPVYGQVDYRYDGCFAEYMVSAPERLSLKPKNLDYIQAASVPVGAMAAWDGLFRSDAINVQKGQAVLIHAAAGGVGVFAVQFARWKGATVIVTGSASNKGFLLTLGADQFIDYNLEDFSEVSGPVDGVLDAVGGDTQLRSLSIIKPGGVLASLVGEQWHEGQARSDITKMVVHGGFIPDQLPQITRLLESEAIKPVVSHVFDLQDYSEAFLLSKAGHVRGKIVLKVV